MMNYVNQYVLNRPYKIDRITNNFGGFFSRFDDMQWYLDNYQTSKGYRFRTGNQPSATAHWNIVKGLNFRGCIASDLTFVNSETRNPNTVPLAIGNSGYYGISSSKNGRIYGDALLTYNAKFGDDFKLLANVGFQGRHERWSNVSAGTRRGGLSTENWFSLNASVNTATKNGSGSYSELLKYAYLGTVNFSFRDYAFVEFTGRRESSSSLPPGSNTFFYPSVNESFVFSDAFHLPSFIDFGKFRASYDIVGNAPPVYAANNAFNQGVINNIVYNSVSSSYGNDKIRPEKKKEFETGMEMKFFQNRLGFDFAYYNNHIVDEILWLSVPSTVGASNMLTNVGELSNYGVELSLYFSPIRNKDMEWTIRTNHAVNRNKVVSLMEGVDRLTHSNIDAGAAKIVSEPG